MFLKIRAKNLVFIVHNQIQNINQKLPKNLSNIKEILNIRATGLLILVCIKILLSQLDLTNNLN